MCHSPRETTHALEAHRASKWTGTETDHDQPQAAWPGEQIVVSHTRSEQSIGASSISTDARRMITNKLPAMEKCEVNFKATRRQKHLTVDAQRTRRRQGSSAIRQWAAEAARLPPVTGLQKPRPVPARPAGGQSGDRQFHAPAPATGGG